MKNLPEDAVPIVVTRTSWSPLAPSLELLNDYKENRISWCQYEERYREEMLNSDEAIEEMKQIFKLSCIKDVYLICYEKPPKNCHRHILIDLINELNVWK